MIAHTLTFMWLGGLIPMLFFLVVFEPPINTFGRMSLLATGVILWPLLLAVIAITRILKLLGLYNDK